MMMSDSKTSPPDTGLHLQQLNAAFATGEPAKIAVALLNLDQSDTTKAIIQRSGSNLGLWDLVAILNKAGVRLKAVQTDPPSTKTRMNSALPRP